MGAHPHNWILQVAVEWGILALALLAIALVWLARAIKHRAAVHEGIVAVTLSFAVCLTLGLVDGNLVMPVSQIGAALTAGILIGGLRWSFPDDKRRGSLSAYSIATSFLAVAAAGIVITFAITTLPDQPRGIGSFRSSHPEAWLVPRFWEQGNLP